MSLPNVRKTAEDVPGVGRVEYRDDGTWTLIDAPGVVTLNEGQAQAKRYNKGKLLASAIDPHFEEEVLKVLTFGAEKYGRNNWLVGLPFSELLDSVMRHLLAIRKGEDRDAESGCLHSAHIACNMMFLTRYTMFKNQYSQFDDRPEGTTK